jgi:hypothetical protein
MPVIAVSLPPLRRCHFDEVMLPCRDLPAPQRRRYVNRVAELLQDKQGINDFDVLAAVETALAEARLS